MPQELTLTAGYVKGLINKHGSNSVLSSIFEANNPIHEVKHLCDLIIDRTNDESQSLLYPDRLNTLKHIIFGYNDNHFSTTLFRNNGLNDDPSPTKNDSKYYIMSILAHYVYHALSRSDRTTPSLDQKQIISPYTAPTKFIKRQAPTDYYKSLILQDLVTKEFVDWEMISQDDELITCHGYIINTSLARRSCEYQKGLIQALLSKNHVKLLRNDSLLEELIVASNAIYWDGTIISSNELRQFESQRFSHYDFSVLLDDNNKPYIVDFKQIKEPAMTLYGGIDLHSNNIVFIPH